MAIKAEMFVLPSRYAVRYTHENGKQEYFFPMTRVSGEQEARIMTGEEPEVITDLKQMFPQRRKKAARKPKAAPKK